MPDSPRTDLVRPSAVPDEQTTVQAVPESSQTVMSNLERQRERRARQRERRRESVRLADYSTIGLAFPIAIALGWFAGGWLGGLAGAADAGHWIGGGFGLVAGFYNVYKTAVILQQQDDIPAESKRSSGVER